MMNPVIKLTRIKIYYCKDCTEIFSSAKQLEKHCKHARGVFKCKDCNSWFQTNRECTQHEMSHLPRKCNSYNGYINETKCNLKPCNIKAEPIEECLVPNKNKNGFITCPVCGIELKTPRSYKAHYNIQHCRKYICHYCDKGFGTKNTLTAHIKIHFNKIERPYKCDVCGKGFTQSGTVKIHIKRMHDRIFDQKCKYCKKAFPEYGALTLHLRTHTGYKPYQCNYCTKTFSDPSAYKRHIRTHTGEMRYACEACPMKFSDASGLIAHKKRHVGIKNFKCNVCKKKFMCRSTLKIHVEAVHDERVKIYECDNCGKRKTTKKLLQDHIRAVHTKASKYKCAVCKKHLTTKRFLENHLFKIHNIDSIVEEKPSDSFVKTKSQLSLNKHNGNAHKEKSKIQIQKNKQTNIQISNTLMTEVLQKHEPKLYECQYCEREFHDKTDMKVHMYRFHGKENNEKLRSKNYVFDCSSCNEKFSSKTSLRRHAEMHQNALYCDVCEAEFFTVDDLRTHKRKCLKNKNNRYTH